MIEKELDPSFRKTIEDFPTDSLPKIYELIEKYKDGRQIVIFKSREDVDEFLKSLSQKECLV